METGDKNRNVSQRHTLFCEESLGKIEQKMSSFSGMGRSANSIAWKRWFLRESEYFSENFDGEAINWSGVVNFHCVQTSLVMSMQFIFSDDWYDARLAIVHCIFGL